MAYEAYAFLAQPFKNLKPQAAQIEALGLLGFFRGIANRRGDAEENKAFKLRRFI